MCRKDLLPLFVKKFGRPKMTIDCLEGICKRHGIKTRRYRADKELWVGAKYLSTSGYVYVRIGERSQFEGRNWAPEHKLLWEQKNGAVPKGYKLKCLDGNRLNTDPSNWECVPNAMLGRLHARNFENAPAILKPTILAVARLEHATLRPASAIKRCLQK
jgi:hypothetical protein